MQEICLCALTKGPLAKYCPNCSQYTCQSREQFSTRYFTKPFTGLDMTSRKWNSVRWLKFHLTYLIFILCFDFKIWERVSHTQKPIALSKNTDWVRGSFIDIVDQHKQGFSSSHSSGNKSRKGSSHEVLWTGRLLFVKMRYSFSWRTTF